MSSVRMCDSCSEIFSEQADGWSTGSAVMSKRNSQTGRMEQITVVQDKCPDCTEAMIAPRMVRPQPQLGQGIQHTYLPTDDTKEDTSDGN